MATIVAFHAHPDDEVLLTGGTLARLAAEGNRVIIVVATDGVMGPANSQGAQTRLDELQASASALGVARVVHLGYADSGHGPLLYPDPPDRQRPAPGGDASAGASHLAVPAHAPAQAHSPLRLAGDPHGIHPPVRDHALGGCAPLRAAEARGPRRSQIVGEQQRQDSAPVPGDACASCAHLRAHARARVVRRTRLFSGRRRSGSTS